MLFESLNTQDPNQGQVPPNIEEPIQEPVTPVVDPTVTEINLLSKIELLNSILVFNEQIKSHGYRNTDIETLLYFYSYLKYETCLALFNKILDDLNKQPKK